MARKTIAQELKELCKDYYILTQDNLLGKPGDVIRVVSTRNGYTDMIKSNGEPHWFAASVQYELDKGYFIPFSHIELIKFHAKIQKKAIAEKLEKELKSIIDDLHNVNTVLT